MRFAGKQEKQTANRRSRIAVLNEPVAAGGLKVIGLRERAGINRRPSRSCRCVLVGQAQPALAVPKGNRPDTVSHLASVRHTTVSMTNPADRVEIITSVQRPRRWTASEKVRIVEETFSRHAYWLRRVHRQWRLGHLGHLERFRVPAAPIAVPKRSSVYPTVELTGRQPKRQ